jgi:hypothetical protein
MEDAGFAFSHDPPHPKSSTALGDTIVTLNDAPLSSSLTGAANDDIFLVRDVVAQFDSLTLDLPR